MSFHCLGDWEASNGQRYVALMDTHATSQTEDDPRPRYRCAVSHLLSFPLKAPLHECLRAVHKLGHKVKEGRGLFKKSKH